jgi:hypothetical protein
MVRLWATVAVLIPFAGRVSAQAGSSVAGGVGFERYSFGTPGAIDIESLTLLTVPFGGRFELGRRVSVGLTGAWARASLVNSDGEETEYSGLTDTEASVVVQLAPGWASLTGVALLPTGSKSMTFEEMIVAGAVAADQLPFRITHWGTGGGAGMSLAVTRPIGSFAAGLSVGYVVARTFEPLAGDAFEYRPGNQLQVVAAVDRLIGESAKAAVRAKYQRFGADEGDGRNLFQSGDRLTVTGSLDFAVGRSTAIVYAGWYERDPAELLQPPPEILPSQTMLYGGAGLRASLGSAVLQPSVDVRVVDTEVGPGYTVGVGASLEAPAGTSTLIPSARLRFGSAESVDGVKTRFTGLDAGFSIRLGARER